MVLLNKCLYGYVPWGHEINDADISKCNIPKPIAMLGSVYTRENKSGGAA